jgi:hypothetical protein
VAADEPAALGGGRKFVAADEVEGDPMPTELHVERTMMGLI